MATRETPAERRRRTEDDAPPPDAPDTGTVRERKEKIDDDVDSILDEIDEVLEENAEEWVRGFVQKGGQ